jgi:xylan 1,4-beta-xylosidase
VISTWRNALKTLLAGVVTAPHMVSAAPLRERAACHVEPKWGMGIEGQRKSDLGNGMFLNPIVSGDRPDPPIPKDGEY